MMRWLALLFVCCLAADAGAQRSGTVLVAHLEDMATNEPVADAQVSIPSLNRHGRTDVHGLIRFTQLPSGVREVEVRSLGYGPMSYSITFREADSMDVVLPITPTVQQLTRITVRDSAVSPFLEEFERRRRRGIGQYITWDHLSNRHGSSLQTLFQEKFRGIKAIPMPGGGYRFVSTRGPTKISGGECAVATYYNGVRGADISSLELLGGIEYYSPGYAPIQYRDSKEGTACGVLLFWPSP